MSSFGSKYGTVFSYMETSFYVITLFQKLVIYFDGGRKELLTEQKERHLAFWRELQVLNHAISLKGRRNPGGPCTLAHCSHLDVYISRKIKLCVVNLEGQFQTSLEAKPINFLIRKFRSIILIFLLFFAGIVQSSAFWTLSMLFQKG